MSSKYPKHNPSSPGWECPRCGNTVLMLVQTLSYSSENPDFKICIPCLIELASPHIAKELRKFRLP